MLTGSLMDFLDHQLEAEKLLEETEEEDSLF